MASPNYYKSQERELVADDHHPREAAGTSILRNWAEGYWKRYLSFTRGPQSIEGPEYLEQLQDCTHAQIIPLFNWIIEQATVISWPSYYTLWKVLRTYIEKERGKKFKPNEVELVSHSRLEKKFS